MKRGKFLNLHGLIEEWTEFFNLLFCARFCSKTLSIKTALYISPQFKAFLMYIAAYTSSQSYTVTCSQSTAFLKIYILYCPFQISGLRVKLIHFSYVVSREKLRTCTYHLIVLIFHFCFLILSQQLCWEEENFEKIYNYLY